MNLLTGLFRAARKRLLTTDNDMGMFRDKLNELVTAKDTLNDDEIVAKVEELKGFTKDLPGDDDKAKLDRFLEDFKSVKEQDPAAAKEAASMVADLFEKLDTAAMQDVPSVEAEASAAEEPAAEETATETLVEGSAPEDGAEETESSDVKTEEIVEETEAPAKEDDTTDADPNAEYSLEEIYQFIKKRMAEDAANCTDSAAEEEMENMKEEPEPDGIVGDSAPSIPVTFNNKNANGSLGAMFAKIKNGGR